MESEVATAAIIGGYWQATAVVVAVVVLAVGAFSLVSFWAGRHIDTKFDKHAAVIDTKLDQHAAVADTKFDQRAAVADTKFDQHVAALDTKLDQHAVVVDTKFDQHAAVVDTKFNQHAAVTEAYHAEVKAAIARGTKEHDDWRVEMKAINEKVTDLLIEREVERRMQASRGGVQDG